MAEVRLLPLRRADSAMNTRLHVWVETRHPDDVAFGFEGAKGRAPGALASSVLLHAAAAVLVLVGLRFQSPAKSADQPVLRQQPPQGIVWLVSPGPGGGGGGGGNGMKAPPRKVEMPGRDQMTVPVVKPKPVVIVP